MRQMVFGRPATEPATSSKPESKQAEALATLLEKRGAKPAAVVVAGERPVNLPGALAELLLCAAQDLAEGKAVSVVATGNELTTQEAADILNVSRPFLITLLERGDIAFHKVGSHRRVPLHSLLEYKTRRDEARRSAIRQMAQEAQASGLYQ